MSEIANIYDNGPISPIAKIKDNLSVWTSGQWSHYQILNMEPMPRSRPLTVDPVALSGATFIAANGLIAQQLVAALQLQENDLLHLRWEPIDDVEGILWEQASIGRFVTRGAHSRVDVFTSLYDPYLCTTTFFILGQDRDINLQVQNPNAVALPQARFAFFGFRYKLDKLDKAQGKAIMDDNGRTTWLPAEGF